MKARSRSCSAASFRVLTWLVLAPLWATAGESRSGEPEEPVLGTRAGFELSPEVTETVALATGARLRAEPDLRAAEVVSLPEDLELPVIERRGTWVRVQYGHSRGWVLLRSLDHSPLDRRAGWLHELAPTAEELSELRGHLQAGGRESTLGPYRLLTDVPDSALLTKLNQLTSHLSEAYEQRFGLSLLPPSGEVIALFADGARYRQFQAASPSTADLDAPGHAGNGLAAVAVDSLPPDEIAGLVVHEITHLMNRRALGRGENIPAWLDEGLAEDLAFSDSSSSGEVRLGSLAGRLTTDSSVGDQPGQFGGRRVVTLSGPRVQLLRLAKACAASECPPLADLVDLPWIEFKDPARRSLLYSQSAFFIRFLLDGEGSKRAPGFRAFLRSVSEGGSGGPAALAAAVGATYPQLEAGFTAWLRIQAGLERPVRP